MSTKIWWIGAVGFMLALCLPLIATAAGPSIGVNFVGGSESYNGGAVTAMGPAEVAGVVPQANWNNAGTGGIADRYGNETGVLAAGTVRDANAQVLPTVCVDWDGPNTFSTTVVDAPGGNRLMKGYLDAWNTAPATVTVRDLPGEYIVPGYDVLLYFDGLTTIGREDRIGRWRLFEGTDTSGLLLGEVFGRDSVNVNFSGCFVLSTGTGSGATAGNYVQLLDLHAPTFTIEAFGAFGDYPRAPINAIQIVPYQVVPEPATWASLVSAVVTLVLFRRSRALARP